MKISIYFYILKYNSIGNNEGRIIELIKFYEIFFIVVILVMTGIALINSIGDC